MKLAHRTGLVVALLLIPAALQGDGFDGVRLDRSWPCYGDVDLDYDIDLTDLSRLLSNYGITDGAEYEDGDLDEDGDVDLTDLGGLLSVYGTSCPAFPRRIELAGNRLDEYPFFEYVRAFNHDAPVMAAIDPTRYPDVVGQECDLYIVEARSQAEWESDPVLVDVRPTGPQQVTPTGTTIQENMFRAAGAGLLDADAGTDLGRPYDFVLDCNRNGLLDAEDYIDGGGSEAGFYVVVDTTQPGPLAVREIIYSGGTWLGQDTYYPADIASMGQLPLIVISHGNGHDYTWYDHLGYHLASWGYIVMSHTNNTQPGIEAASTTTLTNTDYIIGHQGTIYGGVLDGHIDSQRITWIGHSRGGEGIARAYDRLYDGSYTPEYFTIDDILLLSSMAPTDFLKTANSNPHGANYHLWTVSADADVDGSAECDLCQTFHLHDRATGFRHSTVIQGAGHGDLHDGGGSSVATGPCLIGRENTHLIQKGYFLPLIKHYIEGNIPAQDFFWRQWESFRPIGAPTGACIVVTNTYHNGAPAGNITIDDYQRNHDANTSSSGGAVSYDVQNLTEGRLDDNNSTFTWTPTDPMNGMTHASSEGSDDSRGVVFDWDNADRFYELEVVPALCDFSDHLYLSCRACQGTRHPYTTSELGDLTFTVTLRDASEVTSSIQIGAYGAGIEEPYQRSGGWHNEFETIRIRLTDFLTNGSSLDLTDVVAVRFEFGPTFGSAEGRLGLDDIELSSDRPPNVFVAISIVGGAPGHIAPGQEYPLLVRITALNETYVAGTATLHYRYDNGEFQSMPLIELGDGLFETALPAADCSDTPEFYLSAEGSESGLVTSPPGAPVNVYAPEVGEFVVFFEQNMDDNPGWSTTGLWAHGQPTGGGGEYGGPDPTSGYTGLNVYGYNLNGDYENNLPERHLTTAVIDCSGRTNVHLSLWRWLGVEQPAYDHAYVRVSNNGSTWHTIWSNGTEITDSDWVYQQFDISQYAAGQSTVYIRWTMGITDSSWRYCGWNIDDVQLLSFECE
jgi:hypothetical protein